LKPRSWGECHEKNCERNILNGSGGKKRNYRKIIIVKTNMYSRGLTEGNEGEKRFIQEQITALANIGQKRAHGWVNRKGGGALHIYGRRGKADERPSGGPQPKRGER